MKSVLVSECKGISATAVTVLTQYGDVDKMSMELFALRTKIELDTIRDALLTEFPSPLHILIAEVTDVSYRGDGAIGFDANLLRQNS